MHLRHYLFLLLLDTAVLIVTLTFIYLYIILLLWFVTCNFFFFFSFYNLFFLKKKKLVMINLGMQASLLKTKFLSLNIMIPSTIDTFITSLFLMLFSFLIIDFSYIVINTPHFYTGAIYCFWITLHFSLVKKKLWLVSNFWINNYFKVVVS